MVYNLSGRHFLCSGLERDHFGNSWENTTRKQEEELQRSLNYLGIRIGCEWSKNNDVRKINTDMLEQWGSELQKAAEDNPDKLPIVIADIRQKVFELVE